MYIARLAFLGQAMHRRTAAAILLLVMLLGPIGANASLGQPDGDDPSATPTSTWPSLGLYLRAGVFDPLSDPEPGPAWLREGTTHPLYVLQFDGPIQKAWREAVEEAGAELLDYLPDFAYFVRIPSRHDLADVRDLPHVRYLGPAHAAYRIDPALWKACIEPAELEIVTWGASAASRTAEEVLRTGGMVISRDYEGLTVEATPGTVIALVRDPSLSISWVEPKYWPEPLLNNDARSANARQFNDGPYQADDLSAWSYNSATDTFEGWTGDNVTVTIADSGMDDSHPGFSGRIAQYYDYNNDGQMDELGHGTHCAGIALGDGSWRASDTGQDGKYAGIAPAANLVVQEVFNNPYGPSTYNRDATRAGSTISSNSWGYGEYGAYYTICQSYDDHTRDADPWNSGDQPLLFTFSAGNDGSGSDTVTPPATAKNIITVGATGNDRWGASSDEMVGFSSRGPTDDGRIKPDVVMPGYMIIAARSTDPNACQGWSSPSDGQSSYVYSSGTSMAAPGAAGAAAVVTQYLRESEGIEPSPAVLKASLINGARPLPYLPYPGMAQGWGAIDLAASLFENGSYRIFREDQMVDLDTEGASDTATYWFMVRSDLPLKVTLVWTDPGGVTSSTKHLVNDLDLELVAPDGTRYPGNNFVDGQSRPNDSGYQDHVNNVEGFLLDSPAQGIWQIRVKAYNVPSGPQDFALVLSGNAEKGHVDLAPVSLSTAPGGLEEFSDVRLSTSVKNLGNRVVDLFDYRVEQVTPSGTVRLLAEGNLSDLAGGAQRGLGWTFSGARGTHTLRVTLDPENVVVESDESNNVLETKYLFVGYGVRASVAEPELSTDPGVVVDFSVQVQNAGNVPDELRVSITSPPMGWMATLAADTFSLVAGQSTQARVSVVPPADALAGDLAELTFTVTSRGNATKVAKVTLRATVNQVYGLELSAPLAELRLLPGGEGGFQLLIKNPGNGVDVYELVQPENVDAGWWPGVPEPYIEVGPRNQSAAVVVLRAPDPAPAGSSVRFEMLVRSERSGMEAKVPLSGLVIQFFDNAYELEMGEREVAVGAKVTAQLTIENRGNGPVEYSLDARLPSSEWTSSFDVPKLRIIGYSWGSANLTFTVPDRAIAQVYAIHFSVLPSDGEPLSQELNLTVLQFHSLAITVVSAPATVTQGETTVVKVRLQNLGNGVETPKVLVPELPDYWSYELDPDEVEVQPFSHLDLDIAVQTNELTAHGDYDVGLLARYGPSPQASSEVTTRISVITRADLLVVQGLISTSEVEPTIGSLVQVLFSVENAGETPARDIYIQFLVDNVPVGQPMYLSSLEPGEVESLSTTWTTNSTGIHELTVVVDYTGDVDETSEDNNRASSQVRVLNIRLRTDSPGPSAIAGLLALAGVATLARWRRRRG